MPKQCLICEKKSVMSSQRKKLMSKYNPTPRKRVRPNLQVLKVPLDVTNPRYKEHAGQKITACTKCIKALGKSGA
jgi:ribosomal protein L28